MVMDYLGIALTELAAISERRTSRLVDATANGGLPPMLVDKNEDAGLNSGMMMPHYTAASLVLENRTLSSPDSIGSLPVSAQQEDHNANAMTAARHAAQIVSNTAHVIAIECYVAARVGFTAQTAPIGGIRRRNRKDFQENSRNYPLSAWRRLVGSRN